MKLLSNIRGFTLIEFIIAMTIFFIVSGAAYIPYSHYQQKGLLNQGVKEIAQSLYETRNLSINGLESGTGNVSVGLYFNTDESYNQQLLYFTYPHTFTGSQIYPEENDDIHIYKVKELPVGVQLESVNEKKNMLVVFQSISGTATYYSWDEWRQEFLPDEVNIHISYKWSTSPVLQRTITYYTQWNIADY